MMPTDSCGPRNASRAPFCAKEVGLDVAWLCSFPIPLITGAGASTKPIRQPVMAYVLESDPATSTVSLTPGIAATRSVPLCGVEGSPVAALGAIADGLLRLFGAAAIGVFGQVVIEALAGGALDVAGRGEIGSARAKIDYSGAFAAQAFGVSRH